MLSPMGLPKQRRLSCRTNWPATWIHVKIVVAGDKARLYVNHQEQPTLIINDVKSGAAAKGGIALWFEGTTIAHYANLKIQPAR